MFNNVNNSPESVLLTHELNKGVSVRLLPLQLQQKNAEERIHF